MIVKLHPWRDLWALSTLMLSVWQFGPDRGRGFKLQERLLALRYVLKELHLSAAGGVAVKDGNIMGLMLIAKARHHLLGYGTAGIFYLLYLLCNLLLWILRYQFCYDYGHFEAKAQAQALKQLPPHLQLDGQFLLLVVSPQAQGQGLGRQLLAYGQDLLRARGCRQAFLFTDSFCNFGFYKALGLTCQVDIKVTGIFGPQAQDRLQVRFLIFTQALEEEKTAH